MRKSGLVDNPLAEEREIALEQASDAFMAWAFRQADAGNLDPIIRFVVKVDGDAETARSAILDTIKEMQAVPTGSPSGPMGRPPMPGDPALMGKSLDAGGVPGQAAAQPRVSPELAAMMPRQMMGAGGGG